MPSPACLRCPIKLMPCLVATTLPLLTGIFFFAHTPHPVAGRVQRKKAPHRWPSSPVLRLWPHCVALNLTTFMNECNAVHCSGLCVCSVGARVMPFNPLSGNNRNKSEAILSVALPLRPAAHPSQVPPLDVVRCCFCSNPSWLQRGSSSPVLAR